MNKYFVIKNFEKGSGWMIGIVILAILVILFLVFSSKTDKAISEQGLGTSEQKVMDEGVGEVVNNVESSDATEAMEEAEDLLVDENETTEEISEPGTFAIIYTDDGFEPSEISVSAGETVTFMNNSTGLFWPASNVHPTHKQYPGSDIKRCGQPETLNVRPGFDACRPLEPGESYLFVFSESGSWKYHDHLRASEGGTVIVN